MKFLDSEKAQNIFLGAAVLVIIVVVVSVVSAVLMALANGL